MHPDQTPGYGGGPGRPARRRRSFSPIFRDLGHIPAAHLDRLWDWLCTPVILDGFTGPRYLSGAGFNATLICVYHQTNVLRDSPVEASNFIRKVVAALWCQDHPGDFVSPEWCPDLCVIGEVST